MSKDIMPEFLKEYLESLSPEQKDQMWIFLDENPLAVNDMIALVGNKDGQSHNDKKRFAYIDEIDATSLLTSSY